MAKYCITAANHKNPNNHVASSFEVRKLVTKAGKEVAEGPETMPAAKIVELLVDGNEVITGKVSGKSIELGEAVEFELRIVENKKKFPISDMPGF